jgi:hypothetical protein
MRFCLYLGLEEQGLYRVVGVNSKVTKLLSMGLDRRKADKLNLEDSLEWESKTITSALKTYLRQLPEPLMTFRHHFAFIAAASNWISWLNFVQQVNVLFLFQNKRLGRNESMMSIV